MEKTHHARGLFLSLELKPGALVASNTPSRRYESVLSNHWKYRQSNKKKKRKNSAIWELWKPLAPGLKLKIQLLASFVNPACDIKFPDTREQSEFLCVQSTTQRNLIHKTPSVRALMLCKPLGMTWSYQDVVLILAMPKYWLLIAKCWPIFAVYTGLETAVQDKKHTKVHQFKCTNLCIRIK